MIVALVVESLAFAKCGGGGLSTWPASGGEIGPSAQIVVVGTGSASDQVADLGARADLALVSGADRIPLEIEAILAGSFRTTQAVLRPIAAPDPGRRWTLEGAGIEAHFAAVAHDPPHPPAWRGAPQVLSTSRVEYGCGPAVRVNLSARVEHAVQVEATVWAAGTDDRAIARLLIEDGAVTIGHGMCAGAFELEQGRSYFADLVAVDAAGRRVRADDSPIPFEAP